MRTACRFAGLTRRWWRRWDRCLCRCACGLPMWDMYMRASQLAESWCAWAMHIGHNRLCTFPQQCIGIHWTDLLVWYACMGAECAPMLRLCGWQPHADGTLPVLRRWWWWRRRRWRGDINLHIHIHLHRGRRRRGGRRGNAVHVAASAIKTRSPPSPDGALLPCNAQLPHAPINTTTRDDVVLRRK